MKPRESRASPPSRQRLISEVFRRASQYFCIHLRLCYIERMTQKETSRSIAVPLYIGAASRYMMIQYLCDKGGRGWRKHPRTY